MPDFDTADASLINTFGENVTYTPNAGAPVVVKAFFQMPDERPDTFDVEIQGSAPQLTTHTNDTPTPDLGDLFTVRGVDYTVKEFEIDESALRVFHLIEA